MSRNFGVVVVKGGFFYRKDKERKKIYQHLSFKTIGIDEITVFI